MKLINKHFKHKFVVLGFTLFAVFGLFIFSNSPVFALTPTPTTPPISLAPNGTTKQFTCGKGDGKVMTRFNFGCKGTTDPANAPESAIVDIAYTIIRFLTVGVGLVLVASIIYAGIQYASSGGNPEETSKAKGRILRAMVGLLFYLLISALAQFLVPGGLF